MITARFRVWNIEKNDSKYRKDNDVNFDSSDITGEYVRLSAVYSDDKDSPNYSYSQATPSADLNMYISNPGAFGYFEQGKEYNITFEKNE